MAGHSKWANIQHRKNAQDAKKGQLFTKLIREINVAARMGGAELESNSRLRLAVDKALTANMTKDTIQRAIQRGVGGVEGQQLEEIRYEGYGPNGAAVIVDAMTDNRNRTVSEIRHAFTKCGGNLGTEGSVSYLFTEKGQFIFAPGHGEETILDVVLNAGAEDVQTHADGTLEVTTAPADFEAVQQAIAQAKLATVQAEITWLAATEIQLEQEATEKMTKLLTMLSELDDVQMVYTNATFAATDDA